MSKRKKPPSQRPHRRDKEEAGEKLTADRKWILDNNWDTIRRVALQAEERGCHVVPGKFLMVCVVDCEPFMAQHYGAEAASHWMAFRQSRGEFSLMWLIVEWKHGVPGSQNWAPFSKMAVQMEQRMPEAYLRASGH